MFVHKFRFPVENITFFLSRVQIMLSMRAIQSDVVPILHKDEIIHWGTEFLKILCMLHCIPL